MLNFGVIASSGQKNNLPTPGGQTYTGTSNYVAPVFDSSAPQAPVVSYVTFPSSFAPGGVATTNLVFDVTKNSPNTVYNITVYNADKTVAYTYQQIPSTNPLAGVVPLPDGGTATVQAVASVNNVTTYSAPTSPTLQQLGVGGTHL